jgi:signal transduction histidine kinase
MPALRSERTAFRVVFAVYAAGLLVWLTLGLLPALSTDVPIVRHALESLATGTGPFATAADRIMTAKMSMETASGAETVVQYGFSLLNLALGLMLAIRRPDDRVPRLLAFALLGTAATFNIPSHQAFHITGSPWPVALIHFTFHIVSGVCYLWAVILFPDGTLPRRIALSRNGLRIAVVAVTAMATLVCWRSSFLSHPQFFVVFFGIAVPLAGIGAQSLKLLDPSTPMAERRTARLLCAALLPALGVSSLWLFARIIVWFGGSFSDGARRLDTSLQNVFPALFAIVPVVLFAGVVRYRLWDLDRLLSKVLLYTGIAAVVSAVYVVAVATGGWLAGGALWWTVAVLSAMAVAIAPLQTRARRWANRVVFGQDLSPMEAMRTLISGLEHLAPGAELDQLVEVAVRATRAQRAELWLIDGDEVSCAARAPAAADSPPPLRRVAAADFNMTTLRRTLGASQAWPLQYQGELLGALAVWTPGDVSLSGSDEALLADVAQHAGLLVNNAVLTLQLARHVQALTERAEQLTVVRRRLVAAQDAERRRLERDLHDGAQQALVATIIGLNTVAPGSDPSGVAADLAELDSMLQLATDALSDLCGTGIPLIIKESGLAGAMRRAADTARRSGLDVLVGLDPNLEVDPQIASGVYFCCVEALQNIAKHAHASVAAIDIRWHDGEVVFVISDDGVGFSTSASDGSGGLAQLAERLAALGGTFVVDSAAGHGSRLQGRVPAGPPSAARQETGAPASALPRAGASEPVGA